MHELVCQASMRVCFIYIEDVSDILDILYNIIIYGRRVCKG